jgi:hypothetical protein
MNAPIHVKNKRNARARNTKLISMAHWPVIVTRFVAGSQAISKPDISSPQAVKKVLLDAKTVGYVDPDFGSAGMGATEAIDKLGINDQIAGKSQVPNGGGPVQHIRVNSLAGSC